MHSHLLKKRDGQIFVNAALCDGQNNVDRRAARIALRENRAVNVELINRGKYKQLGVHKAHKIMTPEAWVEEMGDCFSGPIKSREANQIITKRMKKRIIAELERVHEQLHQECLKIDRKIDNASKVFNI